MIEGKCAIFRDAEMLLPTWEWTQQFYAVPRVGEFVQGPQPQYRGVVTAVTHCDNGEGGIFLGIVVD